MTDARISQIPVEVLVTPTSDARVSQVPVEVLVTPDSAARVSQMPVEVLIQVVIEDVNVFLIA